MKRFLAVVAVVVVISTAVGVALVVRQRRRLAQMSDEELRALLDKRLGERVPPEQLSMIQDAVIAKVRGRRKSSLASVSGTVDCREQIVLPPGAVIIVELFDTSRPEAAEQLGVHVIDGPPSVPVRYTVGFDPDEIIEHHRYSIGATISADDRLLWTTDGNYPVITGGHPTTADLVLVAVPEPVSE